MFKRFRGPLLLLMLLSLTARVFTGAQEAQVNFTSLLVDQHVVTDVQVDDALLLQHALLKDAGNASSIPDKHRTYATYKKYVTPDKSFSIEADRSLDSSSQHQLIGYTSTAYIHSPISLPVSNSPPAVVSAHSLTHTTTADASAVLENYFGEIEINNSAGGLSSFQL